MRPLAGHPLIAYTVSAALECGEFDRVIVSSDDPATLELAHSYGADALRRPEQFASDTSPDIEWVSHALSVLQGEGHRYDAFSILRPTSPFRTPSTIRRAFAEWRAAHDRGERYSSLRAVEPCSQRPEKMWRIHGKELVPLLLQPSPVIPVGPVIPTEAEGSYSPLENSIDDGESLLALERSDPSAAVGMTQEVVGMTKVDRMAVRSVAFDSHPEPVEGRLSKATPQPWHDSQAASLPVIYVQNASLEIAWTRTVEETGTISGHRVLPFLTRGHEGFDINTELEWSLAEMLIERGEAALPDVRPPAI